jgi:hypothetical protein
MRAGDGTNAFAGIAHLRRRSDGPSLRIRRVDSDVKMRRQIDQR